jgi:predicted dehydrogenase
VIYNNRKKIIKKLPKNWNRNTMFIDITRDFISNILKNKKTQIPLKDGIYTLKIALALKKSLKQSRKILI